MLNMILELSKTSYIQRGTTLVFFLFFFKYFIILRKIQLGLGPVFVASQYVPFTMHFY